VSAKSNQGTKVSITKTQTNILDQFSVRPKRGVEANQSHIARESQTRDPEKARSILLLVEDIQVKNIPIKDRPIKR
jgi:hypothetical protein